MAISDIGDPEYTWTDHFVMGDNWDNSKDSRYFGCVPRAAIVGEAKAVLLSGDLDHYLRPRFDRFFSKLR